MAESDPGREARLRLERSKRSERAFGKWLIKHDGPDPDLKPGGGIVSTTGRVGHITELQYDCHSRTYAGENKNEKVWAGLWNYWIKVVGVAIDHGKQPMIRLDFTNDSPTQVRGRRIPVMHVITEERHAELLDYERSAREGQASPLPDPGTVRSYSKQDQLARSRKRR